MTERQMLAGLTATAFERIVQNNSTAAGLNSTTLTAAGSVLRFSVETRGVRVRHDGTDPTASTGVLYNSTASYEFQGFSNAAQLKFMRASGGTAVINVTRYRHAGDQSL